jgi:NAD(P)-dependent dehydrogenase (short-subunit alcohol dehydrogenase family)
VNLSGGGIGGPHVLERASAYTASKAAVVMLTETWAAELRPLGVRVNAVAPGSVPTGFMAEVLGSGPERASTSLYEEAVQQQAQPQPSSLPELERLLLFLLSDESSWLTGKLISAHRDPVEALVARRAKLESSSLLMLRRIDDALYAETASPADRTQQAGTVR